MTAQAYNALTAASLGADKIIRATTMQSLYDNPTAIAQRGSGAPWNNGIGAIAVLTSGSGNWTVPDGVYRIKVTAVGGGGGGMGSTGSATAGGDTTFSTITANGGGAATTVGGAGGSASGGDINIAGQAGGYGAGGSSFLGFGAHVTMGGNGLSGAGYGAGGGGSEAGGVSAFGGGGGGSAIKILTVAPGDSIAYSVGTKGTGPTSGFWDGGDGTAGIIIIEY